MSSDHNSPFWTVLLEIYHNTWSAPTVFPITECPFWDPAAATSQPSNFLTQQPLYLNKYGLHCYVIYINLYSSKKSFLGVFFFCVKIPYKEETKLTIGTPELTIKMFRLWILSSRIDYRNRQEIMNIQCYVYRLTNWPSKRMKLTIKTLIIALLAQTSTWYWVNGVILQQTWPHADKLNYSNFR